MLGGVIDPAETIDPKFGRVASILAAKPSNFRVGKPATAVPVGILVYDAAIGQNDLGRSDMYTPGQPAALVQFGAVQIAGWTKTAVGAIDPVLGCKVVFEDATGNIEFLGSGTAVPANWTQLKACVLNDELRANRVTLFVGVISSLVV